jgi:hypothetical protein
MPASNSRADAANALVKRGFEVFPCHYPVETGCSCRNKACTSPAKHPWGRLAPNGCLNASGDLRVIDRWWRDVAPANIGVRTGKIVIIDIDPRHGGDETLADLERKHGAFPSTWRVITGGGGEHIYFRAPGGAPIKCSIGDKGLGAGVDVRGVGGYVLGPGSEHISRRVYAWSVDHHPDDIELAVMPDWLVALCQPTRARKGRTSEEWASLLGEKIAEGKRNNTAASLYGHLIWRGLDAEMAFKLLQAWNVAQCDPPLSAAELVTVANSILLCADKRKEAARDGY